MTNSPVDAFKRVEIHEIQLSELLQLAMTTLHHAFNACMISMHSNKRKENREDL